MSGETVSYPDKSNYVPASLGFTFTDLAYACGAVDSPQLSHHQECVQPPPYVTMLDSFEILTTSGVVLWSKSYAPVSANIVNSLIKEVFIEESVAPGGATSAINDASAARNPTFKKERYTLKWATAKDFGLIFVV